jgi:hypothetical protein
VRGDLGERRVVVAAVAFPEPALEVLVQALHVTRDFSTALHVEARLEQAQAAGRPLNRHTLGGQLPRCEGRAGAGELDESDLEYAGDERHGIGRPDVLLEVRRRRVARSVRWRHARPS